MIAIKTIASSSKGNCYYITDGSTPLLLEAGIKYKDIQKALNFNTKDIAGCLITHEHGDHSKGIKDLLRVGKNVYMSQGTKEALELDSNRIKTVEAKTKFQIGTWSILPFEVEHDVSEPIGFLLQNEAGDKLLFATDTYYIRYKFRGLTHLLIECNYSIDILNENIATGKVHEGMKKRLIQSHFSLENVKEFLTVNDLSKVQEIHLLHLSDSNSDEARFKQEVQELTGKLVFIA